MVIDEAYVDFGAESAVSLLDKYDNLLVVQTLSKSRSLAGARVGLAISNQEIIADLNRIKFSFNPYNLNRLSILAGTEALKDVEYFNDTRTRIMETREDFVAQMEALGFTVLPSKANFVFATHPDLAGQTYFEKAERASDHRAPLQRSEDLRIRADHHRNTGSHGRSGGSNEGDFRGGTVICAERKSFGILRKPRSYWRWRWTAPEPMRSIRDVDFFNHMMELFTRHGRFDIAIDCKGDTDVDYHHTVEDIGIALGRAFREALGDKKESIAMGACSSRWMRL